MASRTCPRCRSVNLGSALVCVTCGAALEGAVPPPPPAPRASGSDPREGGGWERVEGAPPAPPTPVLPTWVGDTGGPLAPPRRRSPMPILIGIAVLAVAGVAFLLSRGSGGLPDEIDGLSRLTSPAAQEFERILSDTNVGGMRFAGAMYGQADQPSLVVEILSNVPDEARAVPLDAFFSQAAGGFAATSGGSIDTASAVQSTDGDTEYRCAPLTISSASSGFSGPGVLCLWRGDDIGIVITLRTTDASTGLGDARTVHDAVA